MDVVNLIIVGILGVIFTVLSIFLVKWRDNAYTEIIAIIGFLLGFLFIIIFVFASGADKLTSIVIGILLIIFSVLLVKWKRNSFSESIRIVGVLTGIMFLFFSFTVMSSEFNNYIEDELSPLVLQYNQNEIIIYNNSSFQTAKEPVIKGKCVYIDAYWENDTDNGTKTDDWYIEDYPIPDELKYEYDFNTINNTKITFFIKVNETKISSGRGYVQEKIYGEGRYVGEGQIIITDVIVIYWPDKIVVGKYRIIGDEPPERTQDTLKGDDNIYEWINSLPRSN